MTIETKFSIKDHVYTIIENEVKYVDIDKIGINVDYRHNTTIKYVICYSNSNGLTQCVVDENKLFSTKEELIKSL